MEDSLPNNELIHSLITTYYTGICQFQDDGSDKYVSSYWKYHTQLFKLETDENDNIKPLCGIAISDQNGQAGE